MDTHIMIQNDLFPIIAYTIIKLSEFGIVLIWILLGAIFSKSQEIYTSQDQEDLVSRSRIVLFFLSMNIFTIVMTDYNRWILGIFMFLEVGLLGDQGIKLLKIHSFHKLEKELTNFLGYKIKFERVTKNYRLENSYTLVYTDYKKSLVGNTVIINDFFVPLKKGRPCIREGILNYFDPVDVINFGEFVEQAPHK